jgi:hypothetical protein
VPWEGNFSDGRQLVIGHGIDGIERIKYFEKSKADFDLLVFPDCHDGWLQKDLMKQGFRVWGSSIGSHLELLRWKTKEIFKEVGLPVNECYHLTGVSELRDFFEKHPSNEFWWVKISPEFRGLGETWKARDYFEAKPHIDDFEFQHEEIAPLMKFIVEASIVDACEDGYDGYCIDGQFPHMAWGGIEKKDKSYFIEAFPYDELDDDLRAVNERLSPFLKETGYRNFFHTELRDEYCIDVTARQGSPAGELVIAMTDNLPEVIWNGAEGHLIEPTLSARYGAQIVLVSEWAEEHRLPVKFPQEIEPWINLYNHCRVNGIDYIIPQVNKMKQIGSVVAIGSSPKEVIDTCKERAQQIRAFDIEVDEDSLDKAMEEMDLSSASAVSV